MTPDPTHIWIHPDDVTPFDSELECLATPNRSGWELFRAPVGLPYELRAILDARVNGSRMAKHSWIAWSDLRERYNHDSVHGRLAYCLRAVSWGGPGYIHHGIGYMTDAEQIPTILELPLYTGDSIPYPIEASYYHCRKQITP